MGMRGVLFTVLLLASIGCAHTKDSIETREKIYAPVEASLVNLNQKVKSHFLVSGIPDGFNKEKYKKAVEEVCYATPACKAQAEAIFNTYGFDARKIDDTFSVMLCDKEMESKVMEAFSCNNRRVPIQNWKKDNKTSCEFEKNWRQIEKDFCSE